MERKRTRTVNPPAAGKKIADMNKTELQEYAWENYKINLDPAHMKQKEMVEAIQRLEDRLKELVEKAAAEKVDANQISVEDQAHPSPAPRKRTVASGAVVKGSAHVFIANQHSGGISFPRKTDDGRPLPPLRLSPGEVTPVDREVWESLKKKKVVEYYIDKGLLAEATKQGRVPVLDKTSTTLPIPEHLQDEKQEGKMGAADLRKKIPGTVTLDLG